MNRRTATLLVAIAATAMQATSAVAQGPIGGLGNATYEYAVKYICGVNSQSSPAAARGSYYTAINVHNPGLDMPFVHKVAPAGEGARGGIGHTQLINAYLIRSDEAVEVDCQQIKSELENGGLAPAHAFHTGFFVIQSRDPLDVVAVYTTANANGGNVSSFHTERVMGRAR